MKWVIDGNEFLDPRDAAEYITDSLSEEVYDEMLDECYEDIAICGYTYSPALALYRVDPVAYRCGMNDYYDSLASDIAYDIDRMDDGDSLEFYGFTVEAVEE